MNNALNVNANQIARTISLTKKIMLESNESFDASIYNKIDKNILEQAIERVALNRISKIIRGIDTYNAENAKIDNNINLADEVSTRWELTSITSKGVVELADMLTNNRQILDHQGSNNGINFLTICNPDINSDDTKQIVNTVNSILRTELLLYKNKLNPLYEDMLNEVRNALETNKKNPVTDFIIREVTLPECLRELDNYKTIVNYHTPNVLFKEPREIIKDITLPLDKFDNKLINNVAVKEELNNLLGSIYSRYGITIEKNEEAIQKLKNDLLECINSRKSPYTIHGSIDLYLLSYFILKYNIKIEYIKESTNVLNVVKDLGGVLVAAAKDFNLSINKGLLILNIDNINKIITISHDVFYSTDDTDNLIEAILGLAVSKEQKYSDKYLNDLLANRKYYLEIWEAYVAQAKEENPMELYKECMDLYEAVTVKLYRTIDDRLRIYSGYGDNITQFTLNLRSRLNKIIFSRDIENIIKVIDLILGDFVFSNTNYNKFLKLAKHYKGINPNASIKDIIPFISTELVVDALTKNLKTFDIE